MRQARAAVFFALSLMQALGCTSHANRGSSPPADGGLDATTSAAGADTSSGGLSGSSNTGGAAGEAGATLGEAGAGGAAGSDAPDAAPKRFVWQLSYDQSYAAHVAVDSKGAAIVSGTFFDTKDITLGSTTLKSHGSADVMLSRVLASGTVDWARGYGGTSEDYPVSFVLDTQDRIDLTGLYNGTGNLGGPDFPPFAGTAGRYDASIAGFAANGDPRWSTTINSNAEAFAGEGLAVDAAGTLFVPGSFLGTASIGGVNHVALGSWDAFLAQYTEPNGILSSALPFGGSGEDRANFVLLTGTDQILVGKFSGSVSFPTTPVTTLVSAGGFDVYIARVSLAGAMTSVVAFGGANDEEVSAAHLDSLGRLVLAGNFSSPSLSILGGQALHTAGGVDIFVARLSPTLAAQWSVSFGSDADDAVRDLSIASGDTLAITGEFRDHLQLGTRGWDATPSGDAGPTEIDFFVATLDPSGSPSWSYAAGGLGQERGLGIASDSVGGLYVSASFTSAIDFGGGTVLSAAPGAFGSALIRYAP